METITRDELQNKYPRLALSIHMLHFSRADFVDHMKGIKDKILTSGVDGVCRTYFVSIDEDYFSYDMDYYCIETDEHLPVVMALRKVIAYDNYVEYEAQRVKTLGNVPPKNQKGLNYN